MVHWYSDTDWRRETDFWCHWFLVSSITALIGLFCGVGCAYVLGAVVLMLLVVGGAATLILLGVGSRNLDMFIGPPAALIVVLLPAFVGLLTGIVIGAAQVGLLPWSRDAQVKWSRRTALSWSVGVGLGFPLALGVNAGLNRVGVFSPGSVAPLAELTAVCVGLALGIGLRPALPSPRPPWTLWMLGQIVATTLGLAIAGLVDRGPIGVGLSWLGLILGPVVYGAVTATLMVWVERRRQTGQIATDQESPT